MDKTHIYGLIDPRDRVLFYVGRSRRPKARLGSHIAEARGTSKHAKSLRIREILATDMQPELVILETVGQDDANIAEERWIAAFRQTGSLLNHYDVHGWKRRATATWHECRAGWSSGMTGDDLRAVRAKNGWSQAELARQVGVTPAAVSRRQPSSSRHYVASASPASRSSPAAAS